MELGLEIERRYLIAMPDVALLCERYGAELSRITQTYLLTPEGYSSERVRCRSTARGTVYTHTRKRRLSGASAVEEEETVDEAGYRELLLRADPARLPIEKQRLVLRFQRQCCEIDLYPFWSRIAVLETELSSPDADPPLPDELTVLREITGVRALSNHALAAHAPSEQELLEGIPKFLLESFIRPVSDRKESPHVPE